MVSILPPIEAVGAVQISIYHHHHLSWHSINMYLMSVKSFFPHTISIIPLVKTFWPQNTNLKLKSVTTWAVFHKLQFSHDPFCDIVSKLERYCDNCFSALPSLNGLSIKRLPATMASGLSSHRADKNTSAQHRWLFFSAELINTPGVSASPHVLFLVVSLSTLASPSVPPSIHPSIHVAVRVLPHSHS